LQKPDSRARFPLKQPAMSRRTFLKGWLAAAAVAVMPTLSAAAARKPARARRLCFYHIHTGEHLSTCYFRDGSYRAQALSKINHLLRDHRSGEVISMEIELLDLLHRLAGRLGTAEPFHVICGYRSPQTNALLRRNSKGVAKRSLHMYGQAIDIRVPGLRSATLRKAALNLKAGGVGYYPQADFVHIDTGRVRFW